MKAIILAAGRGSRMGSITNEHPKCLTLVQGKTLIDRQITSLTEAALYDIGLVVGYKAEMLTGYGSRQFHNANWSNTNMVASLACAKDWLDTDDCIVSYSDIFYDPRVVKKLIHSKDDIAISYDPNWLSLWSRRFENPLEDAETFLIDNDEFVTEIGRKTSSLDHIQGQYMGLLKFSKGTFHKCLETIRNLDSDLDKIDMTSFLNTLVKKHVKIKAIPNYYPWGECDTQHDLKILNQGRL